MNAPVSSPNLETRVEALEQRYAELLRLVQTPPALGDWKSVLGIFKDDPNIDEFHREVRRVREEDRAAAQCDGDS